MIRLTLYGISGLERASYEFKPGERLDVHPRPVFTVERIVVEIVDKQEALDV